MRTFFSSIALGLFSILMVSCATPKLVISKVPIELDLGKKKTHKTLSLHVEPFTVSSSVNDQFIVGEARVGFTNSKKPIRTDEPVNAIVTNLLIAAFLMADYNLLKDKEKADVVISGTVEHFWVDEYVTGWSPEYAKARVSFDVLVKKGSGEFLWAGSTEGTSMSKMTGVDATDYDIPTLVKALENAVESLFANEEFLQSLSVADSPAQVP